MERFFNPKAEKTWNAQVETISGLIGQKLESMVETNDPYSGLIFPKRKAIWALLPHTVFLGQCLWGKMLTETIHTGDCSQTARLLNRYVTPFVTTLLDKPSSRLLDRAVLLASPHIPSLWWFWDNSRVSRWNAIALNFLRGAGEDAVSVDVVGKRAVSDVVVSESVADMLLQIAWDETLRPQILDETWAWLKKPLALPVLSQGREDGTTRGIVRHIRGLGDIKILKSYFLLVWSEWDHLYDEGVREMEISIREDFGGVERLCDREELIERLDQVLAQLILGPAHLKQHLPPWKWDRYDIGTAVSQYSSLRETLLDVHGVHKNVLLRTFLSLTLFGMHINFLGHLQDPT